MRVALTGAASGIGAEVTARLSAAGHTVIAFDIAEPTANVAQIQTDFADNSIRAALSRAEALSMP